MTRRSAAIAVAALVAAFAAAALLRHRAPRPARGAPERPGPAVRERPDRPGRFEMRFSVMGTDGRFDVRAPHAPAARRMCEPALARLRQIERAMSTYLEDSDVSRLNRLGGQGPVAVGAETRHVLERSLEFSGLTGGAFDVTYAPLRGLWLEAQQADRLPSERALEAALAAVGHEKLLLGPEGARFGAPGMAVDLGGIAKGYAIDAAAGALRAAGASAGIVDVGGDLRLFGLPEPGGRWKVEVNAPAGVEERVVLAVPGCAVATSGDYARRFSVAGERFSHIIDPRTGRPVADVPSVTVVAPDAITADALATGLSVLGPADGVALVDSLAGVECMMTARSDGAEVRRHLSRGFARYLEEGR